MQTRMSEGAQRVMGMNERLVAGARFGAILLLGSAMAAAGLGRATAQEANAEESHPAHIHSGSCGPNLGDVVYPLTNVSDAGMAEGMAAAMATPGATASPSAGEMGQKMGSDSAVEVQTSYTLVNAPLDKIVNGDTAINIHESKDKIQNYIACGDIGGQVMTMPGMEGGVLTIGLKELNDSGYSGVAVLRAHGDQTAVVIYLAEGLSGAAATPAAAESGESYGSYGASSSNAATAPAASSPSAQSAQPVAVSIKDFAYQPASIDVAVGTKVTWTNNDSTQHTVTGTDQTVIKSPVLNPGDTISVTFDKPGTYDYHCEFHANMHGTVVVK
jgi:plastocyanin